MKNRVKIARKVRNERKGIIQNTWRSPRTWRATEK
jgi:hypothetical protein